MFQVSCSRRLRLMMASGLLVSVTPAWAADATNTLPEADVGGSADLEEVVVTATRREESLGRVPISVAVYSQDLMDAEGVKAVDDIARLTPGVTFTHTAGTDGGSGNKTQIAIRGIQSSIGAATTGIYIDDTPIQVRNFATSTTNAYPEIFDLQRVEVLRGPQGTLFGAGAEGGTVRFITPAPSLEKYSMYARSELLFTDGGAPSYELGVAGGGPILEDVLGFRASAWDRRDGGWIDRVDPTTQQDVDRNSNSQESKQFRLALSWKPGENLKISPSVLYQDISTADTSLYWNSLSDPSEDEFRNGRALAQPNHDRFTLPVLGIDYDFGWASLISSTAFLNRRSTGVRDYTNWIRSQLGATPLPTLPGESAPVYILDTQNNFTQEMRLRSSSSGPLQWVAGLFYSRDRQYVDERYVDADLNQTVMGLTAGAPFCPASGCDVEEFFGAPLINGNEYFRGAQATMDEQFAGYGQIDYNVTEKLKLTGGVRLARVEFMFDASTSGPLAGGTNLSAGQEVEHPVTPKYGASYQFDSDNLVYFSAAKGFRPGGAQVVVSTLCGADLATLGLTQVPDEYKSDSVWSYELGSKNRFADGRVQLNSSVFWIDWKQIQQSVPLPSCGSKFIANLGAATSKGADLQAQFYPLRSLGIDISAGYTDATYNQTVDGGGTSIIAEKGDPIGVPKWGATLSSQYDFYIAGYKSFARFDYQFIGTGPQQDPRVYGYDPALFPTQQTRQLSLRTGFTVADLELSLFMDNVTNDEPILSRGHDTLSSPIFTSYSYRPRTTGLTAIFRF